MTAARRMSFAAPGGRRHSRGAEPSPVVPDPGITIGRFRVLQRTDGRWIVYDPERLPADRTVGLRTSAKAAIECAEELVKKEGAR